MVKKFAKQKKRIDPLAYLLMPSPPPSSVQFIYQVTSTSISLDHGENICLSLYRWNYLLECTFYNKCLHEKRVIHIYYLLVPNIYHPLH